MEKITRERAEELLKNLLAYKHAVNGYHYGWELDKDNPKKYIQADIEMIAEAFIKNLKWKKRSQYK